MSFDPTSVGAGEARHVLLFPLAMGENALYQDMLAFVLLKVHSRDAVRWLGHSNIQTTMNVYAQAPDEMQEETARLMADPLLGLDKPSIDRHTPTNVRLRQEGNPTFAGFLGRSAGLKPTTF